MLIPQRHRYKVLYSVFQNTSLFVLYIFVYAYNDVASLQSMSTAPKGIYNVSETIPSAHIGISCAYFWNNSPWLFAGFSFWSEICRMDPIAKSLHSQRITCSFHQGFASTVPQYYRRQTQAFSIIKIILHCVVLNNIPF